MGKLYRKESNKVIIMGVNAEFCQRACPNKIHGNSKKYICNECEKYLTEFAARLRQKKEKRRIVTCIICKGTFVTNHVTKNTCSEACAKERNRRAVLAYSKTDKAKATLKKYQQSDKHKKYIKEYQQRPDVKAREKIRAKKRYDKKKKGS